MSIPHMIYRTARIYGVTCLACAALLLAMGPYALAGPVSLPCGVRMDLPDSWDVTAHPILYQPGNSSAPIRNKTIQFSAVATTPPGGMVQVSLLPAEDAQTYQQLLDVATPEVLREIETTYMLPLAQHMVKSGMPLLHMNPLRTEAIGGMNTMVISYRREGDVPPDPWEIIQYKIPLPGYLVEITFGYREASKDVMVPFLNSIKRSITITPVSAGETGLPVPQATAGKTSTEGARRIVATDIPPQEAAPARQPLATAQEAVPQPALPLFKTSFNCAKAVTPIEQTICTTEVLADMDRTLARLYSAVLKKNTVDSRQIRHEQRAWLTTRESECQGPDIIECLRRSYEERTAVLQGLLQLTQ